MWCTQCERKKPDDQFLQIKKRGWRVTKCNACAASNMEQYARGVVKDASKVRDGGD